MRVCFKNVHGNSGADVWMISLANALKKIGAETELCFYNNKFQYFPYALKSMNGTEKWDIIHSNTWNGFAFKEKNIPLVVTEHHVEHIQSHDKYKTFAQRVFHKFVYRYEKKSLEVADSITCHSMSAAGQLKAVFGYDAKMIYPGIDTENIFPRKPVDDFKKLGQDKIKLFFVGNATKRKGFDLLPRIMEKLGDKFVLVCTSGIRKNIVRKISENIFLIGTVSREALINCYNSCDIFLFPSRLEGFGMAVAEAMACAKPVVATNCFSLPELIVDKKGGFLCEMGNVGEFAQGVIALADNPTLRMEMGAFNRKRVEDKFSLLNMAQRYYDLYKEVA